MKISFRLIFLSIVFLIVSLPSLAQNNEPQLLDGMEIEYTYTDGGAVIVTFYDGLVKFRWVAGHNQGATGEDFNYRTHKISDDIYLVNWQMPDEQNFVNLLINFETNSLYGSALMAYATEQEFIIFDEAVITRIDR